MEIKDVIQLAKRMKMLQAQRDEQDSALTETNKMLDELRLKLIPEAMAEMDIRTLTIDGVGRVQLAMDLYATIKDKEAGYAWLEEHGYDGMAKPYIQPSTFKAAVKEALKAGQEFPDELFSINPFTRASIVKA